MSQVRTSIALKGSDAAAMVWAGRGAEQWAVRTLWLGEGGVDPTYVAAAAGAVAATTKALRIGLFLDLDRFTSPLRIAEDVAVLDNLSGGRIELALIASRSDGWAERAEALLSSWEHGWPIAGRAPEAITPQPIQPRIPCLIAGDSGDPDFGRRQGAGQLLEGSGTAPAKTGSERRVLTIRPPFARLADLADESEALKMVTDLRASTVEAGASELIVESNATDFEATAKVLATLLDPVMRCSLDDIPGLVQDAWQRR